MNDKPKVVRHSPTPTRDPAQFEELGNGVPPRTGADPFADQREDAESEDGGKKRAAKKKAE